MISTTTISSSSATDKLLQWLEASKADLTLRNLVEDALQEQFIDGFQTATTLVRDEE